MASNEDVPILGALRFALLTTSLPESNSPGLLTRFSFDHRSDHCYYTPLRAVNLTNPKLSTQVITQPSKDTPSPLPISSLHIALPITTLHDSTHWFSHP